VGRTVFSSGVIDNDAGKLEDVYGAVLGAGQVITEPGVFATVHCTGLEAPSSSVFVLSDVIVGNKDGVAVPLELITEVTVVVALSVDVNLDGNVDVQDLQAIALVFSATGEPGFNRADVKGDGVVDVLDVVIVGQNIA
jgi:hypothetical protein